MKSKVKLKQIESLIHKENYYLQTYHNTNTVTKEKAHKKQESYHKKYKIEIIQKRVEDMRYNLDYSFQ